MNFSSIFSTSSLPLAVSAIIHLLPLPGVMGSQALQRLYGVDFATTAKKKQDDAFDDNADNIVLALQHRAVLFGCLGGGLWMSAQSHDSASKSAMMGMTLLSDISFLALALPRWKRLTRQMKKVVYADVISIVCLLIAGLKD